MDQHDDLERRLHDMFDDVPPHDDSARHAALEALPATSQRRFRWLPALAGGRPGYRAAFVGLTAGLIVVVAIGALRLTAIDRPSEIGAAPGDLSPPESIHGTILCGPTVANPRFAYTTLDPEDTELRLAESRGGAYRLSIETVSDPRLDGELIDQLDTDTYGTGPDAVEIGALTLTLRNDGGAWMAHFVSFKTDPSDWSTAALSWVGSGGYEGLTAVTELDYIPAAGGSDCGWEMSGYIVDTPLLSDFPEPMPNLVGD